MTLKRVAVTTLLIGSAFSGSNLVQASLIGDTVSCSVENFYPTTCGLSATAVVGPGPEFTIMQQGTSELFDVDIDASSIRLTPTVVLGLGFSAGDTITFSDLDWVGLPREIIGVSNFDTFGTRNLTDSDLTFTSSSITFDLSHSIWIEFGADTYAAWDIEWSAVAAPSSAGLLALGLAGLGWSLCMTGLAGVGRPRFASG
tara:strand:- start:3781 stop:4380 length:600 start_codon:yes stop_codon:yes gene_type:complete